MPAARVKLTLRRERYLSGPPSMPSENLQQAIRSLTGSRQPRRQVADVLRGLVTLAFALHARSLPLSGLQRELSRVHPGSGIDTKLVYRWARGRTALSAKSARLLDTVAPGASAVYDHPVFALLREDPPPLAKIEELLSRWRNPRGPLPYWWFDDFPLRDPQRFVPTILRDDTQALFRRGDLDGFTVILGLVREAEIRENSHDHIRFMQDCYRALPAVLRLPWFRPHIEMIQFCLIRIHTHDWLSLCAFGVNQDVIKRQVEAEVHETIRERCPRNPRTGAFIVPEDPIFSTLEAPAVDQWPSPLSATDVSGWWTRFG